VPAPTGLQLTLRGYQLQGLAWLQALVVLPTSLIANWQAEAARIAPSLRVLTLQGASRSATSGASPSTTWSSPPTRCCGATRSAGAQEFHLLILDEAQTVKNAGSRSRAERAPD
jgi:SNF2 family DNA or RNA helicase